MAGALRATELGAHVAVVERGTLGGTCVNIGCVPSKTLIRAAEAVHRAQRTGFDGIEVSGRVVDFASVMAQKSELVEHLRRAKYVDILAQTRNATVIPGHARFVLPHEIVVGDRTLRAERFLVATGARPHPAAIPAQTWM